MVKKISNVEYLDLHRYKNGDYLINLLIIQNTKELFDKY